VVAAPTIRAKPKTIKAKSLFMVVIPFFRAFSMQGDAAGMMRPKSQDCLN
jgi:hypothetical protein